MSDTTAGVRYSGPVCSWCLILQLGWVTGAQSVASFMWEPQRHWRWTPKIKSLQAIGIHVPGSQSTVSLEDMYFFLKPAESDAWSDYVKTNCMFNKVSHVDTVTIILICLRRKWNTGERSKLSKRASQKSLEYGCSSDHQQPRAIWLYWITHRVSFQIWQNSKWHRKNKLWSMTFLSEEAYTVLWIAPPILVHPLWRLLL